MNIKNLIEQLKEFDEDREIYMFDSDYGDEPVQEVVEVGDKVVIQ